MGAVVADFYGLGCYVQSTLNLSTLKAKRFDFTLVPLKHQSSLVASANTGLGLEMRF